MPLPRPATEQGRRVALRSSPQTLTLNMMCVECRTQSNPTWGREVSRLLSASGLLILFSCLRGKRPTPNNNAISIIKAEEMKFRDFTITLLGFIGFITGVGILSWGTNSTPESQRFISSPEFRVWLLLIGAQTALWFAIVIPLVELLRTLSFYKEILPKCILYLLGFILLFAWSKYFRPEVRPL